MMKLIRSYLSCYHLIPYRLNLSYHPSIHPSAYPSPYSITLGSHCKELRELWMGDAKRVEDSGLIAISTGCSTLEILGTP